MSSLITEELSHRVNRVRDDQARVNGELVLRLKALEEANAELKHRFSVLTRMLIAKQICSAAEIAAALTEPTLSVPAVGNGSPPSSADSSSTGADSET
jgi:hypothetical protein